MAVDVAALEAMIRKSIPDCEVKIDDMRGDGNYISANIISPAFAGLSRIEQHRLVYEAIGDTMKTTLHALALHTSPPAHI